MNFSASNILKNQSVRAVIKAQILEVEISSGRSHTRLDNEILYQEVHRVERFYVPERRLGSGKTADTRPSDARLGQSYRASWLVILHFPRRIRKNWRHRRPEHLNRSPLNYSRKINGDCTLSYDWTRNVSKIAVRLLSSTKIAEISIWILLRCWFTTAGPQLPIFIAIQPVVFGSDVEMLWYIFFLFQPLWAFHVAQLLTDKML